jgi:hypothetical protein
MADFFQDLKKQVFGEEGTPSPSPRDSLPGRDNNIYERESPAGLPPSHSIKKEERNPYFVQIGLDFGTAYSKAVCRDIYADKTWIHIPQSNEGEENPFLMSSMVHFDGINLSHPQEPRSAYSTHGLSHIKMALEKVAMGINDDPVLLQFRSVDPTGQADVFVETCAIYLLAGILGSIREDIKSRFPGEVEGDRIAVNMAIPVANANQRRVNELFERVLRVSWVMADTFSGYPEIPYTEITSKIASPVEWDKLTEAATECFVYPEVSANMQGFVRSRTSRKGLYFFSDTGAGTVDQSIFFYGEKDGKEHLTYLHASVIPWGSSHLERIASSFTENFTQDHLEHWRQRKESGEQHDELNKAREEIGKYMSQESLKSICLAKRKLTVRDQINSLRVVFGGGGHCLNPYGSSVLEQFESTYFNEDAIRARMGNDPFEVGLPIPRDLELRDHQRRWYSRLTVAYGLSFEAQDLVSFSLPSETREPNEGDIWRPRREPIFNVHQK